MADRLHLKLLMPTCVVVDAPASKLVAEAENGWFCLLPRHVDFVAALTPGVFIYWTPEGREQLLAIDEGTLVKCGSEVLVSVRNAMRGTSLDRLKDVAKQDFRARGDRERQARSALARLEAGTWRRLGQLE
ncbi:MAG: F0F1 ATP synthase subunit epsilon [Thiobacillus sp.]|jgi:F-type H+-transporting ATPase subunit epsilon